MPSNLLMLHEAADKNTVKMPFSSTSHRVDTQITITAMVVSQ